MCVCVCVYESVWVSGYKICVFVRACHCGNLTPHANMVTKDIGISKQNKKIVLISEIMQNNMKCVRGLPEPPWFLFNPLARGVPESIHNS